MKNATLYDRRAQPGQRAAKYWFVDGLPELVFGLALVLAAGIPIALLFLHQDSFKPSLALLFGAFLVLFIWDRRILGALKACITYPRTGYVQPPGDPVVSPHDPIIRLSNPPPSLIEENVTWFRNRTVMVLFMGFSFQMMVQGPWSLAAMMAAVAISLYALNRNIEHPYTWWSVMPLGIAGLPFHWLQIPQKVQELMPLLLGGAWLLVRGLWTFVGYLRQNPLPREGRFSIE